jgi:hypothetical protein
MRLFYSACLVLVVVLLSLGRTAHAQIRDARGAADMAAACRASCMADAGRFNSAPSAAQACAARCNAAQSFARNEGRSAAVTTGRGIVPASVQAAAAPAATFGVIFAARAPSAAFGMVVGETDRNTAHRVAEDRCIAGGPGCRLVHSFTAACGAVAQGVVRSRWALVMTSDASTYVVTTQGAGSGADRASAEAEALADCRSRDRNAQCRIVASQCGRS